MIRLLFGQLLITWSLLANAGDVRSSLQEVMSSFSADHCLEDSQKINGLLTGLNKNDYIQELTKKDYHLLSQDLWSLKLHLHSKMRAFYQAGSYSSDCARSLRGAFRAIREVEDYVEEHQSRSAPGFSAPSSAFEPGNPNVHWTSQNHLSLTEELKSGDILLTRGNAFTSAAIASLGEFNTQFSHMSLVYRDENNKIWTVESHIEVGSIVRPLEDHIKDSNFRTMLLRYDDPSVAAKAAAFAFKKVKRASDTTGNIPYDFGFDMDEDHKLFCSETISWAFKNVTNGEVLIPFSKSQLQLRKSSFVHDLGITAKESFIPADIEVDPRFSVIAEWRDANRINDSHEKDAILQAMYSWVDDYNYKMINGSSRKSKFYRNIVWVMRRTPLLKTFVDEKLPLNMSRKLIGYFGVLESIGEFLQKELTKSNEEAIAVNGLPHLPREKYEVLEAIRRDELKSKKKKLHKMFRPVESK